MIYQINRGVNKPIEFKGLKAQYIGYLGGGLVVLLILFAILYLIGLSVYFFFYFDLHGLLLAFDLVLQLFFLQLRYFQVQFGLFNALTGASARFEKAF